MAFIQHEEHENRIIRRLRQVAMHSAPIKVELKDFGRFQSPNTIFINVLPRTPIQDLVREIRSKTQDCLKPGRDTKPHFGMEPHLTIARQISASQFDQAWLEFSQRSFSGSFIADGMVLLKQSVGKKAYDTVCHLRFENLACTEKQDDLFR